MTPLQPPPIYRPAHADELGRAASLCPPGVLRPGDGPQQCFVALREGPLERLLGAAFWRGLAESDGSASVEFEWSVLAAMAADEAGLLEALVAHAGGQCPQAQRIAASAWLPAEHPRAAVLQAAGFAVAGSRQWFSADAAAWREALGTPPRLPESGNLLRPLPVHYEALKDLLCCAALRPSELAHGLHTATSESPSLFDPRCSGVLSVAGKITAACLANSSGGHLTLAALAGSPDACLHLLGHALAARDGLAESASLGFHLDERDPTGAHAGLCARLPAHPNHTSRRHERCLTLSRHAHDAA
jgi:hypothetical protein